jgi:multimeric flavodoxin WrbA
MNAKNLYAISTGCLRFQLLKLKRDKFNEIFLKMLKAHSMILGFPTYFGAISSAIPVGRTQGFTERR